MAFQITYVPINSSHMGKTLPVLRALREAGADLRILCLDELQVAQYHLLPQIKGPEFGYSCLPRGNYRPHHHWFPCAVQRRRIERCFESFLASDRAGFLTGQSILIDGGASVMDTAEALDVPDLQYYPDDPRAPAE